VADALDVERQKVAQALGMSVKPELEAMNGLYGTTYSSIYEFNRNSATHVAMQGAPSSSQHRYITEDIPYLLVPCLEFAALTHTETPTLRAVVQLANTMNQVNYITAGRTLEKLGLSGMDLSEIKQFVSI
jgi:opine dehydrogenase